MAWRSEAWARKFTLELRLGEIEQQDLDLPPIITVDDSGASVYGVLDRKATPRRDSAICCESRLASGFFRCTAALLSNSGVSDRFQKYILLHLSR